MQYHRKTLAGVFMQLGTSTRNLSPGKKKYSQEGNVEMLGAEVITRMSSSETP